MTKYYNSRKEAMDNRRKGEIVYYNPFNNKYYLVNFVRTKN